MMRWVPLVACVVLLAAMSIKLLVIGNEEALPSTFISKPVPAFSLPVLDAPDETVTQETLRGDGPVVLNFWASWCAPCRIEHPKLVEMSKLPGVRVVGINYDQKPKKALGFLKRLGNPFSAIGVDLKSRAKLDFGVIALPESFVIAGDGTIVYKHVGPINPGDYEEKFLPAIEAARAR